MHDAPRGMVSTTGSQPAVNAGGAERGVWRSDRSMATGQRSVGEPHNPWLHRYTVFMALSILVLICSGGLVTSNDAGLAVPDWPTSFGYNMFAFPLSRWLAPGGVRLEHAHRLIATGEGLLSIVLTIWMWRAEPRRWVRNLGYATLGAVIFQGMLGGSRVVLTADWIGIVHGCFAQAFFALTALIALVTSRWWRQLDAPNYRRPDPAVLAGFAKKALVVAILIYTQLALGATMRHAHAGLSIPDFPKAYGHWWPQVHRADLPALNQQRSAVHQMPTTLAQIHLQMTHRIMAIFIILPCILIVAFGAWKRRSLLPDSLRWFASAGVVLVAMQITLGIFSIWTNKAADVATAHVVVGACLLVWSVLTYAAVQRWRSGPVSELDVPQNRPTRQPVEALA